MIQFFSSFCETATATHSLLHKNEEDDSQGGKVFQKIVFLIRDWGFPDAHDYGSREGSVYIGRVLNSDRNSANGASKEALNARKVVSDKFSEIACCLLPPPGQTAQNPEFQGRIDELAPRFEAKLRQFIEDLLLPVDIPVKTSGATDQPMRREELLSLFGNYAKAFNANETLSPESMSQVNIQASNEAAVQICLKQYRQNIEKDSIESLTDLDNFHKQFEAEAVAKFKTIKKFGGASTQQKYETMLLSKIKSTFITTRNAFEKSEKSKLAIIKGDVKSLINKELESLKTSINIEPEYDAHYLDIAIEKLQKKALDHFDNSVRNSQIHAIPKDRTQMEEFVKLDALEFKKEITNLSEQVSKCFQDMTQFHKNQLHNAVEDVQQVMGILTSQVLLKIQRDIHTKASIKLKQELQGFSLNLESSNEILAKFASISELHMSEITSIISEKDQEFADLVSQHVANYHNQIHKFCNDTAFAVSEDQGSIGINEEDFADNLQMFHTTQRRGIMEDFANQSNINNAKTLAKYRQLLTSGLDEIHDKSMAAWTLAQGKVTQCIGNHTKKLVKQCHAIFQKFDHPQKNYGDALQSVVLEEIQKLKYALEEIERNCSTPEKGQLVAVPIPKIALKIQQHWEGIAQNILREKQNKVLEDGDCCKAALQEAMESYLKQMDGLKFRSHSALKDDHTKIFENSLQIFENNTKRISPKLTSPYETILKEEIDQEWARIRESKSNSLQAQRQQMQEKIANLLQQVEEHFNDTFRSGNGNKTEILNENEISNFFTVEFQKNSKSLQDYGNSINFPDSEYPKQETELELQIDCIRNDLIAENTNNRRSFETFVQSTITQTIQTLWDEDPETLEKIQQQILTLLKMGVVAVNEGEVRKIITEQLQRLTACSKIKSEGMDHSGLYSEFNPKNPREYVASTSKAASYPPTATNEASNSQPTPKPRLQTAIKKAKTERIKTINPENEIDSLIDDFTNLLNQGEVDLEDKDIITATKESIVSSFIDKLAVSGVDSTNLPKLTESLTHRLEESTKSFKDKIAKDKEHKETVEKSKVERAYEIYISEFDKHRQNSAASQFLTPKELFDFHTSAKNQAFQICIDLSEEQVKQLQPRFESQYQQLCLSQVENVALEPAIGIDLGTTFSCVAIFWEGIMTVIPNATGKKTTPSYVAFKSDGAHVVGEPAKEQAFLDPVNTIFDAKRLIGRPFNDPKVQHDISNWPFRVVEEVGKAKIEVNNKTYHPEQIGAKILVELKKVAESFLKRPVVNAVITVPAYFNDGQRQATRDAGAMAGLNVISIINEPTAAAFAYKLDQPDVNQNKNILIYDFGGGTFDISILNLNRSQIRALAVTGDTHLGGEDFDTNIVDYCITQFQRQHGIDLFQGRGNHADTVGQATLQRRMRRMRDICEQAKITLSGAKSVTIHLDAIHESLDLDMEMTREEFETINKPLFDKSIDLVEKALKEAKLSKEKIDEIILVGGSTRVPKLQQLLSNFFGGKSLSKSVNQDEAVACGAALQAAILTGNLDAQVKSKKLNLGQNHRALVEMQVSDVTPYATGVELLDGSMSIIIPKNSPVPAKKTQTYLTAYDNQTSVLIVIFEGEHPTAAANFKVGEFFLNGVPPAMAGQQRIEVTMTINNEGILHVTATCETSGAVKELTVREHKGRISAAERKALVEIK